MSLQVTATNTHINATLSGTLDGEAARQLSSQVRAAGFPGAHVQLHPSRPSRSYTCETSSDRRQWRAFIPTGTATRHHGDYTLTEFFTLPPGQQWLRTRLSPLR